jgi:hypothetical protein
MKRKEKKAPEKQYTFLERLAYAFDHREIVTYKDKVKRDREIQEREWKRRHIYIKYNIL